MFQAALAKLEENCRQEMEKHKQLLDKEYEQLLTQFSKELEKLQLKHQEELGKRLKMNINTEKKLIKEVAQGHENEKKSFENKMKAEYKLKKERWKKEMESQETPKSQRNQGNAQCFDNNLTHLLFCHKQNRIVKANNIYRTDSDHILLIFISDFHCPSCYFANNLCRD